MIIGCEGAQTPCYAMTFATSPVQIEVPCVADRLRRNRCDWPGGKTRYRRRRLPVHQASTIHLAGCMSDSPRGHRQSCTAQVTASGAISSCTLRPQACRAARFSPSYVCRS